MPDCKNCGEHVSNRFVRVLGTNDGQTYGCPHCKAKTGMWKPNLRE